MLTNSDGRRHPEGARVVEVPFRHRGVVERPNTFGCSIRLDEPMKHTDVIYSAWNEVWDEGEYDIAVAQQNLDWALDDRKRTDDNLRRAKEAHMAALRVIADANDELRAIERRYGREDSKGLQSVKRCAKLTL